MIDEKLRAQISAFRDFREHKGAYLAEILASREEELLNRQRDQLASGLDSDGKELAPSYSQDLKPSGYFHTAESAARYASWKADIHPTLHYKQYARGVDTPNLFISGKFYTELEVSVTEQEILFKGATFFAQNIISKYGIGKFGLCEEFWRDVMENGVAQQLIDNLKSLL